MVIPEVIKPLISFSYWFNSNPGQFAGVFFWVVAGVAGGLFIVGLVLRLVAGAFKDTGARKLVKRFSSLLMTLGILCGINFFFTQTATPTLGARFWFLLWLLAGLVWFGFILRYAIKVAPRERAARVKEEAFLKYLPSNK